MTVFLLVSAGLAGGALLCIAAVWLWKRTTQKGKRSMGITAGEKLETMKLVIWVCLLNGISWVWCSYLLAYLDKTQIAESLSQVAVTEIIGVVLAYAIKSAVENLSKNNRWPDKEVNP